MRPRMLRDSLCQSASGDSADSHDLLTGDCAGFHDLLAGNSADFFSPLPRGSESENPGFFDDTDAHSATKTLSSIRTVP